jgi:hypothetical protein
MFEGGNLDTLLLSVMADSDMNFSGALNFRDKVKKLRATVKIDSMRTLSA